MNIKTAYDLHEQGTGGFITFEWANSLTALQLLALDKAILSGTNGTLLVLEFSNRTIHVAGTGLTEVFEQLVNGRIKVIREGRHEKCSVETISLFEE